MLVVEVVVVVLDEAVVDVGHVTEVEVLDTVDAVVVDVDEVVEVEAREDEVWVDVDMPELTEEPAPPVNARKYAPAPATMITTTIAITKTVRAIPALPEVNRRPLNKWYLGKGGLHVVIRCESRGLAPL